MSSTVAGDRSSGFSGDGGPATSAQLNRPHGLAVDGQDNLYISANGRVRKVTPAGMISTFAGGGASDPGDGGPAISAVLDSPKGLTMDSQGNLYSACDGDGRVRKVTPAGMISTVAGGGTASVADGTPAGAFMPP